MPAQATEFRRGSEPRPHCSEGYGPGGSALLACWVADDPVRAAAAVRATLRRHGGWPGAPGSVGYLFNEVGRLAFRGGTESPEALLHLAWQAGAEDVILSRGGTIEVRTDPDELEAVRLRLERAGFAPIASGVTRRAAQSVPLDGAAAEQMIQLVEALGRVEGVRRIYTNAEVAGEVLASN
jgi:transcriptional/translational regulatory protein YebC/TACO1